MTLIKSITMFCGPDISKNFCGVQSIPHNIGMNLNNVISDYIHDIRFVC